MIIIKILIIVLTISFTKINSLNEDCFHRNLNKNGRCINYKECPRSKQSKNSVFSPQICEENQQEQKYIVCCPKEGEIAQQKCTEYKKILKNLRVKRQLGGGK